MSSSNMKYRNKECRYKKAKEEEGRFCCVSAKGIVYLRLFFSLLPLFSGGDAQEIPAPGAAKI